MTAPAPSGARGTVWQRIRRHPHMVAGGSVFLALVLLAVAAPIVADADLYLMQPQDALRPPSQRHWFGTDEFGRDLFTRVVHGARLSLSVGVVAVGIACGLGVAVGLASGYYGGFLDLGLMRLVDLMLAFPGILLALAIVAILGPGLTNAMIAVGITGIPSYARVVRGAVLQAKAFPYVEAARAVGVPSRVILVRHVLPNVAAPIIVLSTLNMAAAILTAAALSFLGLGAQPPQPEWGALLNAGRNWLQRAWWLTTFPGLAIMVTVLAINTLGDGLRDVLDPRLKG
ncbi:MAG TPA: ABC transporter permease [bacterium]|nr:ABC transporter permease [bacterium]